MSLLEQDIIKKEQVEISIELDEGNSKKYKVQTICNSKIFAKESYSGHLLGLYYLLS